MSNATTAKQAGGLAAVLAALIAVLAAFGVVHWDEAETAAVVLCTTSGVAVIGAVRAHFRKGSSAEPVAVWAALVAFASSGVGVLLVFDVVTAAQGGVLAGLVATVAAAVGVPAVRAQVYPTSNLQRHENVEPQDAFYGEHG